MLSEEKYCGCEHGARETNSDGTFIDIDYVCSPDSKQCMMCCPVWGPIIRGAPSGESINITEDAYNKMGELRIPESWVNYD